MWQPFSIPNPIQSPAAPKRSRTPTSLERLEERATPLRRRLRAEQPAAGQRRRRLEGLRRRRDRRPGKLGNHDSGLRTVGDVNQDGIDDFFLVGPGRRQRTRRPSSDAYLIFGRAGGFPAELDLNSLDGTTATSSTAPWSATAPASRRRRRRRQPRRHPRPGPRGGPRPTLRPTASMPGRRSSSTAARHLAALDLADGTQDGRIDLAARRHARVRRSTGPPRVDDAGTVVGGGRRQRRSLDDLVIGANGDRIAGKAYVVFGRDRPRARLPGAFELSSLNGSNGFVIPALVGGTPRLRHAVGGAATSTATGSGTSSSGHDVANAAPVAPMPARPM